VEGEDNINIYGENGRKYGREETFWEEKEERK